MISDSQYNYLCDFVNSNFKTYPYYVIQTNFYNYSNNSDYDIIVYLGKNVSRKSVYSFSGDFVCYGLRTSNSNSYNNYPRVQYLGTISNFNLPNYEHNFTNIDYKTYVEVPCLNTNYNNAQLSSIAHSILFGILSISIVTYCLIKR